MSHKCKDRNIETEREPVRRDLLDVPHPPRSLVTQHSDRHRNTWTVCFIDVLLDVPHLPRSLVTQHSDRHRNTWTVCFIEVSQGVAVVVGYWRCVWRERGANRFSLRLRLRLHPFSSRCADEQAQITYTSARTWATSSVDLRCPPAHNQQQQCGQCSVSKACGALALCVARAQRERLCGCVACVGISFGAQGNRNR